MQDTSLIYYKLLNKSLNAPGARVNRIDFLEKNLKNYCSYEQIKKAINTTVINAEIPVEVLEEIAGSIVKDHTLKVTGLSILTGMPGGVAMVATIPADLAQYYYHVIVLAQKLAYLYGYPQFDRDSFDDVDGELVTNLTLFIGVMYDVDGADTAVLALSKNLTSSKTLTKVPEKALTETGYYILKKNVARYVGIKITKKTISQGINKAIPVVSGIISGGVSYFSFTPMAKKLRIALKEGHEVRLEAIKNVV